MDSGNSASMQSSSGGGDEVDFDSRGGGGESSFSSFLNINNFTSSSINPQLNILTHQNPNTFFDPQNNFSNNNENNNLIWCTRGLRSEPNFSTPHHESIATTTTTTESVGPYPGPSSSVQVQLQPSTHAGSDHHRNNLSNVIKNPKKRTRASRRAPTTVLTTDTTNFRQMVQDYTGIPSAPFTGNNTSSSYSRRLDLYSALRSGAYLDSLGPLYPLRPAAKGIMDSTTATTRMNVFGGATSSSSNNYNQQLPLMNLQQQQEESGNTLMNFGNLMSGSGNTTFHHGQENINNGGGVEENFGDGNINNNRSTEQRLVVQNLNISDKTNQGNVASWNYPST